MKMYSSIVLVFLMFACSSLNDSQLLKESEDFKLQIEERLLKLHPLLQTLIGRANRINIQGRELNTDEIELTARISGLQQNFMNWEQQYRRVETLLKEEKIPVSQLRNGYQKADKELQILEERIHELLK